MWSFCGAQFTKKGLLNCNIGANNGEKHVRCLVSRACSRTGGKPYSKKIVVDDTSCRPCT